MPYLDIPHRQLQMYYVVNTLKPDDALHVIDPSKPNLVLIHSVCSSVENYAAQFADPRLTNAYNLIGFDCRMHGKTTGAERKDHTLEDSATCVMAAIEALQIKSYAVVGESVHGSFVGSYLAIKSPEKVKGLFFASPGWQVEPQKTQDMLFNDWWPWAITNKNGKGDGSGSIPEDALEIFRDYFFNGSNRLTSRCEAFANYYQARYGTNQPTHDLWFTLAPQRRKAIDPSLLAAIKVPVLIVQGGADLYTSPSAAAESWQKSFKSARGGCDLRVITGAPNMLMFTDYNIANRFILQFMSRHIE